MLTYEDCVGLCDFSVEEIEAIAEHEGIGDLVAVELGEYILHCEDGTRRIRDIIFDDIARARRNGRVDHAANLERVLKRFIADHPERCPD
ncbi:MAG: hypothetical protein ACPGU7_11960 [Gammaproteobacteria bacterium]